MNVPSPGRLVSVIMITGADEVVDRVVGLEVGADDYITKPFDLREVRARLRSVLRRMQEKRIETPRAQVSSIPVGKCKLDLRSHQLADANGREVALTTMEFDLLKALVERPNQVLSRDELLNEVWGYNATPSTRTVDVHVACLRQKIEENPRHPQFILTVHGLGYKFVG